MPSRFEVEYSYPGQDSVQTATVQSRDRVSQIRRAVDVHDVRELGGGQEERTGAGEKEKKPERGNHQTEAEKRFETLWNKYREGEGISRNNWEWLQSHTEQELSPGSYIGSKENLAQAKSFSELKQEYKSGELGYKSKGWQKLDTLTQDPLPSRSAYRARKQAQEEGLASLTEHQAEILPSSERQETLQRQREDILASDLSEDVKERYASQWEEKVEEEQMGDWRYAKEIEEGKIGTAAIALAEKKVGAGEYTTEERELVRGLTGRGRQKAGEIASEAVETAKAPIQPMMGKQGEIHPAFEGLSGHISQYVDRREDETTTQLRAGLSEDLKQKIRNPQSTSEQMAEWTGTLGEKHGLPGEAAEVVMGGVTGATGEVETVGSFLYEVSGHGEYPGEPIGTTDYARAGLGLGTREELEGWNPVALAFGTAGGAAADYYMGRAGGRAVGAGAKMVGQPIAKGFTGASKWVAGRLSQATGVGGPGAVSAATSDISSAVFSHPTAVQSAMLAPIAGYEGYKTGERVEKVGYEQALKEEAASLSRRGPAMAGFSVGFTKGLKSDVPQLKSKQLKKIWRGKSTKFEKDYGFRQLARSEKGTMPRQQTVQAQKYGGYGSEEAVREAAAKGDIRAQMIAEELGISVPSLEVSTSQKLALQRFHETATAEPTPVVTSVGLLSEQESKPVKEQKNLFREKSVEEEKAWQSAMEKETQVEDIGDVMQRQEYLEPRLKPDQGMVLPLQEQKMRTSEKTVGVDIMTKTKLGVETKEKQVALAQDVIPKTAVETKTAIGEIVSPQVPAKTDVALKEKQAPILSLLVSPLVSPVQETKVAEKEKEVVELTLEEEEPSPGILLPQPGPKEMKEETGESKNLFKFWEQKHRVSNILGYVATKGEAKNPFASPSEKKKGGVFDL